MENQKGNYRSESNTKSQNDIGYYVDELAITLGQVIPAERMLKYERILSDLSSDQLKYGFEKAEKCFKPEFGKTFPAPADIREWAFQWRRPDSKAVLDRGAKPPDWEPLQPGELDRMRAEAAEAREHAEYIQKAVDAIADEKVIPKGSREEDAWIEKRDRQLREFLLKNK